MGSSLWVFPLGIRSGCGLDTARALASDAEIICPLMGASQAQTQESLVPFSLRNSECTGIRLALTTLQCGISRHGKGHRGCRSIT